MKRNNIGAFNSSRYSWLSLRPKPPYHDPKTGGSVKLYRWKVWAADNGIVDKHGNPSRSKVKTMIRHHCLGAKKFKTDWYVGAAYEEQLNWTPADWQELSKTLFSISQSWKAKHGRSR